MLKCTPLLGKYGTYNSDGHAFGRTLLRKEIKPLWNCTCFGEYHEYEIWHIFWKIKKKQTGSTSRNCLFSALQMVNIFIFGQLEMCVY